MTVSDALFDAAIRTTRTISLNDPRRKAVLNEWTDRVYQELKRNVPVQLERAPGTMPAGRAEGRVMKAPALRP